MASSEGGSFDQEAGEPEEGDEHRNDDLGSDERALRGWLPPEQRDWRHPSEIGSWTAKPPYVAGPVLRTTPSGRRAAWATTLVGAGAVAALVSGGLMLASQSRPGPLSAPARVTSPPTAATQSVVRLEVSASNHATYGCGVVVGSNGLVATDATLLSGASVIVATTATGRKEPATLVAVDPASDVGLVRVGAALPVARFVDWSQVQPGTDAVEMAIGTVASGGSTSAWWNETIASIGKPVGSGPGSGMVSVVATVPHGESPAGAVLMEHDGAIVGLLDRSGVSAGGSGAVFLPGEFVFQVAQELMEDGGQIEHGWLGIKGANSARRQPRGALVTAVDTQGPSVRSLRRGDIIEAINGRRVSSMADLRSRLYMLSPGTKVRLRVDEGKAVRTIRVALGTSP